MVSALSGKQGAAQPSIIARASVFFREVWAELKKARWPSRDELIKFTLVVVTAVTAVAVYIAVVDQILARVSIWLGVFPK